MDVKAVLDLAVKRAGSQQKLGSALGGYSQNAIYQAQKAGRVSPRMALRLDEWSHGEFSKHMLRPDIFGVLPSEAA